MKQSKLIFVLIVGILLIGLNGWMMWQQSHSLAKKQHINQIAQLQRPTQKVTSTQAYVERGIISVSGDIDLKNQFPGHTGTIDDPIRIEGYNITASSGTLISIYDTSLNFRIANCLLNGLTTASQGIYFSNVTHGTIVNNTVSNTASEGILIGDPSSSNNNVVANNTVHSNNHHGIRIENSEFNVIEGNIVYNNTNMGINVGFNNNIIFNNTVYDNGLMGIYLYEASNNTVAGNRAFSNSGDGVHLGSSYNNSILNNTAYQNDQNGIRLENSSYTIISCNSISNNKNGNGISLEDWGWGGSHNNTIAKNTVNTNAWNGIMLQNSNYTRIIQNYVYDNNYDGISLDSADLTTIFNNTVTTNNDGIWIYGSSDFNNISENHVYNNRLRGIYTLKSMNNSITGNIVHHNSEYEGIVVDSTPNCRVSQNIVFENNGDGIVIRKSFDSQISSDHTNVISNTIHDNKGYGIRIDSEAKDTLVKWNDFMYNNLIGSQAYDDGTNNIFERNYWNDWSGRRSYTIDGSAGNQDPSPLTNPYHLSAPVITAPTSATPTLKDNVTIQWTSSTDSFGHAITYTVFYSDDDGTSWDQLSSGLTSTSYTWNLSAISNGTQVLLKVQAVDSIGFKSYSISTSKFTIETTPTTTKRAAGWDILLMVLSMIFSVPLLHRKRNS